MTGAPGHDPASVSGKSLDVAETTQLLVVGAGPAGIAAALEGRRRGLSVVLVDENPVSAETMGEDVPHLYGGRMSGAARNRNAMMEAMLEAKPGLEAAFEAGVDVRLGTACWGLYANGPSVGWLPGPVAGLADGDRAGMLGFERVVVAAGARDMGVAFPGWDLPGVMGVQAAGHLAALGALASRRAVLLGSGAEAIEATHRLRAAGIAIAAVVEVMPAPIANSARLDALDAPVLRGHRVLRAEAGPDGVEAVVVVPVAGGEPRRIECDTVLLGIGAVPVIELLDALGCRVGFDPGRGGHVALVDADGRTSLPFAFAVGDCAGTWPAKAADPAVAEAEGRRAAAALGMDVVQDSPPALPDGGRGLGAYRLAWVQALVVDGADSGDEPHVCRCEEVTAREILEVRPPRYLNAAPRPRNDTSLRALLGDGPPNPDHVKRLTRAGMGLCQGRRCREQVACLLALGSGEPLEAVPPATHRAPVRPLPLRLAHAVGEAAEMRQHWDTWFGMYSQYVSYWEVGPTYTVAGRPLDQEVSSE